MIYLFIGLAIILVLLIIFKLNSRQKKIEINNEEQLSVFKENADKIKIELNDIELKSNSWSEEIVIDNSKYGGFNQIAGRGDLNIETVKCNENVLLISILYNSKPIKINYYLSMDVTTLKMKLALQETTTLYINPNNIEEYYLDMEFLD